MLTKKLSILSISVLFCLFVFNNNSKAQSLKTGNEIYQSIQPAPKDGGFKMEGYWVWGSAVIKDEEGTYHMFVSRWPKFLPFHPGWMVGSEIVRATSDAPEGPYEFQEVVLKDRGAGFWDGRSRHNPKIVKHKDTYVLYYMGSTHPFEELSPEQGDSLDLQSPYCTVARSNKRIGIATSKSLEGPWKRYDQPALDVKPGTFYSFLTSNPSPIIREDGSALLVFKSRAYKEGFPFQTDMRIGIARAPHYTGPYKVIVDEPIFGENKVGEVEDPFLWEDEDGLHMLVKDMSGDLSGEKHAGILVHSEDGVNWELDSKPLAYSRAVTWQDGTTKEMGQLERPFMLMEDGEPAYLFFATMDGPGGFNNSTRSWNMVIPLK